MRIAHLVLRLEHAGLFRGLLHQRGRLDRVLSATVNIMGTIQGKLGAIRDALGVHYHLRNRRRDVEPGGLRAGLCNHKQSISQKRKCDREIS